MHEFAGVRVLFETGGSSGLMIEKNHLGALKDRLAIPEGAALAADRSAIHAEPQARRATGGFGGAIVQVPDLEAPRVVPLDPLPIDGIAPIVLGGERATAFIAELPLAIFAIADAVAIKPAPTVVGESFGVAALDDLGEYRRKVFVVIGAIDAGDELFGGPVRFAAAVAGEPIGMLEEEILRRAIRIHARHHDQPVVMRGFREIAVQIAAAEKFRAVLKRVLARIIGDDTAGIDDHALHLGALPEFAPPGNVITLRIFLRDIGLAPAICAPIPRISGGGVDAGRSSDGRCRNEMASRDRHQKIYFSASCMARFPLLLVTRPNDPLVGLAFAPPQFG